MICKRKHIHRLYPLHPIPAFCQKEHIPCECFRVAGDINHSLRRKRQHGGEEGLVAPGTRGVHQHNVCLFAGRCHIAHPRTGIRAIKAGVFDLVTLCVCNRIPHSLAVYFHADNLLCAAPGGNQPDRAGAAIGVYHRFLPGERIPSLFHKAPASARG